MTPFDLHGKAVDNELKSGVVSDPPGCLARG